MRNQYEGNSLIISNFELAILNYRDLGEFLGETWGIINIG